VVDRPRVESVPSLAAMSPTIRAALADAFDEVAVPAGERITRQGDFAYEFFAILDGAARVEQGGTVVATLGPGDLFGEIGILLTGRRTAAIVAETPMLLLALFDQSSRRLCREHPEFAELVHSHAAGRWPTVSSSRGSSGTAASRRGSSARQAG
jgi:CRP/FNR family cyclic AMP-dependent transcriptional regulator